MTGVDTAALLPDVLGEPWVSRILPLTPSPSAPGADYAVLVHQREAGSGRHDRAVLQLPGYVDYFFHTHHAQAWLDAGVEFYALDQRGQGRASEGVPHMEDIRDLRVREEDIRAALAVIRAHGHAHVTLLGHSTGGLQAAAFADHADAGIDALILNSPWLKPNRPDWVVIPSLALVRLLAPVAPRLPINVLGPAYPRFLHRKYGGEWDFDTRYKVLETFLARAGFLRAVLSLQARVTRGLDIRVPTLVAISGRAGHPTRPTPEDLATSDVVLNPHHIRALAPRLGRDVEIMEFPGGVHDLSLSPSPVRERYTAAVIGWALAH
jgi:alpha-beta hydrolase superfamily lysophospholipase